MREVDREKKNYKIDELYEIEDPLIKGQILSGYESSFVDELGEVAQLQRCYSPEGLDKVLSDKTYIKLVAFDVTGKLLSCCIISTEPEGAKDAYANPARYEVSMQNEETLWYVTALFAPDKIGHSTSDILERLAELVLANNAVLGYDHSEKNQKLPDLINYVVQRYISRQDGDYHFSDEEIGRQSFRAIRFKKNE